MMPQGRLTSQDAGAQNFSLLKRKASLLTLEFKLQHALHGPTPPLLFAVSSQQTLKLANTAPPTSPTPLLQPFLLPGMPPPLPSAFQSSLGQVHFSPCLLFPRRVPVFPQLNLALAEDQRSHA